MELEIVVQDCGCISIPGDIAVDLGMTPGAELAVMVSGVDGSVSLKLLKKNSGFNSKITCAITR